MPCLAPAYPSLGSWILFPISLGPDTCMALMDGKTWLTSRITHCCCPPPPQQCTSLRCIRTSGSKPTFAKAHGYHTLNYWLPFPRRPGLQLPPISPAVCSFLLPVVLISHHMKLLRPQRPSHLSLRESWHYQHAVWGQAPTRIHGNPAALQNRRRGVRMRANTKHNKTGKIVNPVTIFLQSSRAHL